MEKRLARLEYERPRAWFNTDGDEMAKAMEGLTAAQKTELAKRFEQRTGDDLNEEMLDELPADQVAAMDIKDGQQVLTDRDSGRDVLEQLRTEKDETKKLSPEQDKAAAKTAAELKGAMETLTGTDEDKIHELLKGKSPTEVQAIKAHFAAQGCDLETELESEMSGDDLNEAKAKLSGDPVQAAVATLENATDGIGTNPAKVHEALESITDPEQRKKVAEEYEKRTGVALDADLKDELSGNDRDLAEAMMIDDPVEREAKMGAIRMDELNHGGVLNDLTDGLAEAANIDPEALDRAREAVIDNTGLHELDAAMNDEQKIYEELQKVKGPEARKKMKEEYEKRTGKDLGEDLVDELSLGNNHARADAAKYYLEGDVDNARAARFRAGSEALFGTEEAEMYKQFEGMSAAERARIGAKVEEQSGRKVDDIIADEMSGLDAEKAKLLVEDGKVSPAFAIRYALDGVGTDNDGLKAALAGKSKEEIAIMRREYEEKYGGSFDDDILDENLGGRDDKLLQRSRSRASPRRRRRSSRAWRRSRSWSAAAATSS